METKTKAIGAITGYYEGSGSWHDSAGNWKVYRVSQTNRVVREGFEVSFTHAFDDGSVVHTHLVMIWVANFIFRVDSADAPIGNGYCIQDYCHYHMVIGDTFVEASYRPTADGIEVFGSSTKNAEGLYIAWHESLRRVARAE